MSDRRKRRLQLIVTMLLSFGLSASVRAQTTGGLPGVFEIAIGGFWATGQALGTSEATLTANQPTGGRSTLFRTETSIRPGPGIDLRVANYFTRALGLETGFSYSRPQVFTSISGDVEAAGTTVAQERLTEYAIDVGIIAHLAGLAGRGGRSMPFVTAGGAYLRQLHQSEVLAETGRLYYGGGGVKLLFTVRLLERLKAVGLRIDGRAVLRDKGFQIDSQRRLFGVVSTSLIMLF